MLNFLFGPVLGCIASLLMVINVIFWGSVIVLVALIKLALPFATVQIALATGYVLLVLT